LIRRKGKQKRVESERSILGVDIGGTKIMSGVITPQGKIVSTPSKISTRGLESKQIVISQIHRAIEKALANANLGLDDIQGIGIGVPGPMDIKNGIILDPFQLPSLHNFSLRQVIREHYNVNVFMNNDANCFLLGESYFGAGQGKKIVLGFTLGTGLGAAIVIDGELILGATETAGEIWLAPYKGEYIEEFNSARGITRTFKKLSGQEKSPEEIAELGHLGDPMAIRAWEEFGTDLGYCIAWCINLLDPDIVILGGSIAKAMDLFSPAMEKYLRQHICPVPAQKTRVAQAILGDNAGFIGAACLALQNY
jgi:glucokinase